MHRERVELVKLNFNELLRPLAVRDGEGKHGSALVDLPKNNRVAVGSRGAALCRGGCERAARPSCGPASLRDPRPCVCGERVLKSIRGSGTVPRDEAAPLSAVLLHGFCFTVSLQPEPPLAVLGEPAEPGRGQSRHRAPRFPRGCRAELMVRPGQALPAAPEGPRREGRVCPGTAGTAGTCRGRSRARAERF